jgi:RNA polymerase sigma-70 factor, ECF subfamily
MRAPARRATVAGMSRVVEELTGPSRAEAVCIVQADGPCPGPCAGLCTEQGLREAYERHADRLARRARAVLGDREQAEEAVQEAFVRAWRACATYDPAHGPLVSWLLVITRNVAVDMVRARARRPRSAGFAPEPDLLRSSDDAVERLHLRDVLGTALTRISRQHREAIVETVVKDRPYAEVAAELHIPAGTVRSRVHYGMRQLRQLLLEAEALA